MSDRIHLTPDELEIVSRFDADVPWTGRTTQSDVAEVVGVLAHDLRNPIAALQGCAHTLVERGDALPSDTRRKLSEIIAKHAERLDWLVRAAAVLGGVGDGMPGSVELGPRIEEAVAAAEIAADVDTSRAGTVAGGERRIRMAIEAVLFAFGGAVRRVAVTGAGTTVEIEVTDADLDRGGRGWKLDVAARLLEADGGQLRVASQGSRTALRMYFRSIDEIEGSRG